MKLIKDLETFASKAEADLEKFLAKAPELEQIAVSVITYVGPLLQTIVTTAEGSAAGQLVAAGIAKAQAELVAAKGLFAAVGTSGSAASIVEGVAADLPAVLTAANVTDTKSVATASTIVAELKAVVQAAAPVTA
jgi:hypothetical protein